ncbi:MAG: hypothetical protein U0163_19280 [Gemmatimonadaceae bacterium]
MGQARWALTVGLGYSRLLWVQFYPRETMQVLMRGLEAAFLYFWVACRANCSSTS